MKIPYEIIGLSESRGGPGNAQIGMETKDGSLSSFHLSYFGFFELSCRVPCRATTFWRPYRAVPCQCAFLGGRAGPVRVFGRPCRASPTFFPEISIPAGDPSRCFAPQPNLTNLLWHCGPARAAEFSKRLRAVPDKFAILARVNAGSNYHPLKCDLG